MLNCKIIGEGKTTLVLLHGFCENNTCFDEQVLLFKDHCKVIVPDLPGFGLSDIDEHVSIQSMAKDIYELLRFLQVKNCVMIGHSMGGYVTLAFEQQFPEMLLGFGLLHSTAAADSEERKAKRNQVVKFIQSQGKQAYVDNFIPGLFTKENQEKPYVKQAVSIAANTQENGIIYAALAMRDRPDLQHLLVQTEKPVFFGVGNHDEIIPANTMISQAATCKSAYLSIFKNTAHMAMQEEPTLLANAVLSYLKEFNWI
jgi:pimeloyl-ACP methyl ester carboxylesterase